MFWMLMPYIVAFTFTSDFPPTPGGVYQVRGAAPPPPPPPVCVPVNQFHPNICK